MSAADEAARLRERADALEAEAKLEEKLTEAKDRYRANLDDPKAKGALHAARDALQEARQLRRGEGVTVGGDAVAG